MNLLQASYLKVQSDIHAGGPGSGRHPGSSIKGDQKPDARGSHRVLTTFGFKKHSTEDGNTIYHHEDGRSATISNKGWQVRDENTRSIGKGTHSNNDDLRKLLLK